MPGEARGRPGWWVPSSALVRAKIHPKTHAKTHARLGVRLLQKPGQETLERNQRMKRLLLLENEAQDAMSASAIAESLGIDEVEAYRSVHMAMLALEKAARGERPLPDGIVLDLDLGVESGYELLRYWRITPPLAEVPLMVWSIAEEQRVVCELFRVSAFVSKWEGAGVFRQALAALLASSDPASDLG